MSEKIGDLTGRKYGHLTVINQADRITSQIPIKDRYGNLVLNPDGSPQTKPGSNTYRAWLCKCDCGNELVMKEQTLTKVRKYMLSCGCVKDLNPEYQSRINSDEQLQWDALYKYVQLEVMRYPENVSLSTNMVMQLKGMRYGQYIRNTKSKAKAKYSFALILEAFEFSKSQIHRALVTKSFVDDEKKFSYIRKIVENRLNIVYTMSRDREHARNLMMHDDFSIHENKEWNYHGTGSPLGAAARVREAEERLQRLIREDEEEFDIDALW